MNTQIKQTLNKHNNNGPKAKRWQRNKHNTTQKQLIGNTHTHTQTQTQQKTKATQATQKQNRRKTKATHKHHTIRTIAGQQPSSINPNTTHNQHKRKTKQKRHKMKTHTQHTSKTKAT